MDEIMEKIGALMDKLNSKGMRFPVGQHAIVCKDAVVILSVTEEGLGIECFEALIDKWEEKKVVLLNKIGNILDAEIKPLVPVDTSRLADSFSFYVDVSGSLGSVEYGTNVEYALYVNDGHVQHKRFLPIKYFSANGKKQLVSKYGVMLSERYIQGKFFLEKGAQSAKPRIERACDSWLRDVLREAIGALL